MKKNYYVGFLLLFLIFYSRFILCQSIIYKPGSGLHLTSAQNKWDFLFSGYINSIFAYHNINQNKSVQNSFYVHRARLDFGFNYEKNYDLFFEFEAAGQRTQLVLAQIQVRLFDNNYIMAGKFINPFSAENNRSTSRLTTIERYSGLNSIFLLPGLDTQFGAMFFGSAHNFIYYLSITNGNGEAAQNIPENNNKKEVTARVEYKTSKKFDLGAAVDYAGEQLQTLSLVDHTFESFNNANISGNRFGLLGNFEYKNDPFLFRGEAFHYSFANALSAKNQTDGFFGGYLELGYFITGSEQNGLQLIGRFETARYGNTEINFSGPSVLNSYILGTNWLLHNIYSFQVNLIYEKSDKPALIPLSRFTNKNNELLFLTTLQLRF